MASRRRSSNQVFSRPLSSTRKVGRPPIETADTLRDIWVFVEASCQLTGLSVSKVCQNYTFSFVDIWSDQRMTMSPGGAPRPPSGVSFKRVLRRETLRRAYYDAKKLIDGEIAAHDENRTLFADCGAQRALTTEKCDVERFWRSLVELEVESSRNTTWAISPQPGASNM